VISFAVLYHKSTKKDIKLQNKVIWNVYDPQDISFVQSIKKFVYHSGLGLTVKTCGLFTTSYFTAGA